MGSSCLRMKKTLKAVAPPFVDEPESSCSDQKEGDHKARKYVDEKSVESKERRQRSVGSTTQATSGYVQPTKHGVRDGQEKAELSRTRVLCPPLYPTTGDQHRTYAFTH